MSDGQYDNYYKDFEYNQGEIKVETWSDLTGFIDYLLETRFAAYWRGQASSEWKLESTATRMGLEQADIDSQLAVFRKASRTYLTGTDDNDETLVLGRHHGLATPLLDWSESPYISLFFACADMMNVDEKHRRALWVFDAQNFEGWDRKTSLVKNIPTHSHINSRLIAQNGLILNLPVGSDLESIMTDLSGGDNEPVLFKITFPDNLREQILKRLLAMGISWQTVYPDLEGACLFANMATTVKDYLVKGVNKPASLS